MSKHDLVHHIWNGEGERGQIISVEKAVYSIAFLLKKTMIAQSFEDEFLPKMNQYMVPYTCWGQWGIHFSSTSIILSVCLCAVCPMSASPCTPSSPGSRPPPPECTPASGRSRGTSARTRHSAPPGPATCECWLNLFKLLDDCVTVSNINIFLSETAASTAQVDINWSSSNLKTSELTLMYYWRWLHSTQHVDTLLAFTNIIYTLDFNICSNFNVFYYLRIIISS